MNNLIKCNTSNWDDFDDILEVYYKNNIKDKLWFKRKEDNNFYPVFVNNDGDLEYGGNGFIVLWLFVPRVCFDKYNIK